MKGQRLQQIVVIILAMLVISSLGQAAPPKKQAIDAGTVTFEMRGDSHGPHSIGVTFSVPFEDPPVVVITPASDLTYRHRMGRPYTFAAVATTEEGFVLRARRSEAYGTEEFVFNWVAVGQSAANFVEVDRPVEVTPATR